MGTGPVGLAAAYLVGPLVTGVLSLALVHRQLFAVRVVCNRRRFIELLRDAKVLGLQLFVMNLGNHAENLLVPKLVGLSAYGYFAAGTLLPRRLEVVPDALNTAFYPVLAKSYKESSREAGLTVKKLGLFMCGVCVPIAVGIFLLAGPIARLLFPDQPEICRDVMRITIFWVPLTGIAYGMGYALNAAGKEADEAKLAIVGTLVSLGLSVLLIWRFGLIGACVAFVGKAVIGLAVRLLSVTATLRGEGHTRRAPGILEPSA
jgi:O-antigen/teichoic acid export membrane protein